MNRTGIFSILCFCLINSAGAGENTVSSAESRIARVSELAQLDFQALIAPRRGTALVIMKVVPDIGSGVIYGVMNIDTHVDEGPQIHFSGNCKILAAIDGKENVLKKEWNEDWIQEPSEFSIGRGFGHELGTGERTKFEQERAFPFVYNPNVKSVTAICKITPEAQGRDKFSHCYKLNCQDFNSVMQGIPLVVAAFKGLPSDEELKKLREHENVLAAIAGYRLSLRRGVPAEDLIEEVIEDKNLDKVAAVVCWLLSDHISRRDAVALISQLARKHRHFSELEGVAIGTCAYLERMNKAGWGLWLNRRLLQPMLELYKSDGGRDATGIVRIMNEKMMLPK